MLKKQNGITLAALVITIIVLLILAGVSISLVVGQGGILGKATNAVDANEVATVKQEVDLAVADGQMAYYTAWTSNQSVKKIDYYYDTSANNIYKGNCTSAEKVEIAKNGETAVYVKYTTKSKEVYYVTITISDTGVSVGDATQTAVSGAWTVVK